tara:strand:- start:3608 stop:4915 length:1308 start_codon:yes stop_codon:yes gene_type:complete
VDKSVGPVTKKEIFGWSMFDFSNSGYTTVVTTAIYAGFFTEYIVGKDSALRDTYWSISILLATFVALFLSPLVGAICDLQGKKKKYLFLTCIFCALPTVFLFFVGPGQVWPAIILLAISNAAFMLSENFCGSFLPDIATKENMAKISGIGWAIGYFGGLVNLVLVQLIVTSKDSQLNLFIEQNQLAMVATGIFVLVAALPAFFLLKERSQPVPGFEQASLSVLFKEGTQRAISTFREAKKYKELFQFFWSFVLYYAGVAASISFAGIFARRVLKFETGDLVIMFLMIQIFAAFGSYVFGILERKTGIKNNILLTLGIWIMSVTLIVCLFPLAKLFSVEPKQAFFLVSLFVGLGLGSTQSSSRALVGLLCPPEKSAEMFGLWGMFNKVAILLSMATFGPLSDYLGSINLACILLVVYFLIGGIMLLRVDVEGALKK